MKSLRNLKDALALHFAHYNFVRIHGSLRVTPAMAARMIGVISTVSPRARIAISKMHALAPIRRLLLHAAAPRRTIKQLRIQRIKGSHLGL